MSPVLSLPAASSQSGVCVTSLVVLCFILISSLFTPGIMLHLSIIIVSTQAESNQRIEEIHIIKITLFLFFVCKQDRRLPCCITQRSRENTQFSFYFHSRLVRLPVGDHSAERKRIILEGYGEKGSLSLHNCPYLI